MSSEKERASDAQRKAAKRAAERDIKIPSIVDVSRRLELESDDCEWLRYYVPDVFSLPFTEDQRQSVQEVGHCLRYGAKKAIAGPRSDGKTSITRYLTLKYMLTGEMPFGVYVAASDPKADQSEKAIKRKLQLGCREKHRAFIATSPLGQDYPFECAVSAYVSRAPSRANNVTVNGGWRVHVQWAGDQLILPSLEIGDAGEQEAWERWMLKPGKLGSILLACGVTSSILQGANVLDFRPRVIILDDLDKRDSLAAEDGKVAPKLEEIIDKTIAGMKGPGERMGQVMLCTVTARKSIAFIYTDPNQKPSWSGKRVKRLKAPPLREDLWDKYIELRQKGMREVDDKGVTVDPDAREAHRFYLDNYEEMNQGAMVGNEYVHDQTVLPDGSKKEVDSLQWCYNFIADNSEEAFKTEYQQEPPDDDEITKTILTAYHVQHNARSGLAQNIVPDETVGIACGLDIKKVGFHYVVWAFSDTPTRAACIEYNFHETKFAGDKLRVEDAERSILNGLHEWREARDETPYLNMDGEEFLIDLALIDQGWKHETWAGQPANHFCAEAGLDRFIPCKGWGDGNYKEPTGRPHRVTVHDNCHISYSGQIPHVNWNTDHFKNQVHEGFLIPPGEPGSLTLFTPSATKHRRQQPHLSFAKHITSEVFEERFSPGYRGMVSKWWKDGSQNHYLDASAQGLVARTLLGVSTLTPITPTNQPSPAVPDLGIDTSYSVSDQRAW